MPDAAPLCGNGRLDADEMCDVAIPAGQPGACPTVCDDRNNCTGDTIVGVNTCQAQCTHTVLDGCCGNGRVEPGESCDDGNQLDYDGCTHDCKFERALIRKSITILDGTMGCDLDGNGTIDNAFGAALNSAARAEFSTELTRNDLATCQAVSLARFVGSDATMLQAPFDLSFVLGRDVAWPPVPENYFSGSDRFLVVTDYLSQGLPLTTISASASNGALTVSAPVVHVPFPWCFFDQGVPYAVTLDYAPLDVTGTLEADAMGPTRLVVTQCGARAVHSWAQLPNTSGLGGGATLLDLIVLGADVLGFHANPTQPDVDVDHDGLEVMMDTDGDHRIDLCIDGSGTQIIGTDCPMDPRIADALSEATQEEYVGAVLAGTGRFPN